MGKRLFLLVMILCLMIEPIHTYGLDIINHAENTELVNAWRIFLKAVSTHDMRKIRNLSAERIRCVSCLENTEKETKEMIKYQTTQPDWYEKLYEKKVYIPINKFFEEDYPIIFTKKFIRKLQDSEPTYAVEDFDDQKIYEVIITTSNPGEPSLGHEGGLHLFQFVKTNKGYKFWGIDTIP